jgi:hypothetical protein
MARLAPTLDLGVVDFLRSEHVEDCESLLAVLQLVHQNQVALAESVQLISSWCLASGLSEITVALQPKMQQLVTNCLSIDQFLGGLSESHASDMPVGGTADAMETSHR